MNDGLRSCRPGIMSVTDERRNKLLLVRRPKTLEWDNWPCSPRSLCIISGDYPM